MASQTTGIRGVARKAENTKIRTLSIEGKERQNISHTSLDFHPTPLQYAEQTTIRCTRSVNANDVRPKRRLVRASARGFPESEVARRDPAEEHKHTRDDVRCWRDTQRRSLLVRILRDEAQRDVLVLQQVWEPITVSKRSLLTPHEKNEERKRIRT